MEFETVQAKIGYQFSLPDRLRLALTAAHRSDIDGIADDGNRGLAKIGMCAAEMVETYRTIVVENGTCSRLGSSCSIIPYLKDTEDANIQDYWFKDKRKRASICCILGIDQYLIQSVRQKDQAPSRDVLATAVSAILGAIWLDLQTQNGNFPTIVEQTYAIMGRMELALTQAENTSTPLTPFSTDDESNAPVLPHLQNADDSGSTTLEMGSWIWSDDADILAQDLDRPYNTFTIENSSSKAHSPTQLKNLLTELQATLKISSTSISEQTQLKIYGAASASLIRMASWVTQLP